MLWCNEGRFSVLPSARKLLQHCLHVSYIANFGRKASWIRERAMKNVSRSLKCSTRWPNMTNIYGTRKASRNVLIVVNVRTKSDIVQHEIYHRTGLSNVSNFCRT